MEGVTEPKTEQLEQEKEKEQTQEQEEIKAQCLGCKKKQVVKDAEIKKTSNGHTRVSGKCSECGRTVSSFIKNRD